MVSPDGVVPSRMVCVSASLPLNHKVQKFSSGTVSPGWSRKKGRKAVVVWWWYVWVDVGVSVHVRVCLSLCLFVIKFF